MAEPDGYTFGVVFDTHAVNPSLIPNLPFDTLRDLTPMMLVGTARMAIVDAREPAVQVDFRDVIAAAKAKPGSVSLSARSARAASGISPWRSSATSSACEFNHIPYRGGGPLMNDAIGNQVPLAIGSVFLVHPYVRRGGCGRSPSLPPSRPQLPGVEPIAEQGVPGFEAFSWWGVFAPADCPPRSRSACTRSSPRR